MLVRGPFREGAVSAVVTEPPRKGTTALAADMDRALVAHVDRRWREALAKAGGEGRHLFDGGVLRWLRHSVSAVGLEIELGRGSFREFVGTNLDPQIVADVERGALLWEQLGNAVGTSAIVVTRDGRLLAGRRSARVVGNAGELHSFGGILEGVEPASPRVDVFASMRRELQEELALEPAELRDLTLNGVILDPATLQPEMLFDVVVPLTAREVRERWPKAASRDEHDSLIDLPDDPRAIESALAAHAPVSPIGRACLALRFTPRAGASQERP